MTSEKQLIECVPNYSEGRDMNVIRQITDAIESVEGVKLLNVDPGDATNRTVVTFVGEPAAVVEAAFRGSKKAAEVIDMRKHHGTHPRMGATDVLPLIPISGISLEEVALLGRQLAERLAREVGIPCYAYEASALKPEHRNLATCRSGEYEAIMQKLTQPELQPDYLPEAVLAGDMETALKTGCTVVGARNYLIAVNFNLNSTSVPLANEIAADVRESGKKLRDGQGNIVKKSGTLKGTKAIGWYIEEYGIAQVSMNITDINTTPLHKAYDEVCRCATVHGAEVTGTEIIGLVPKRVLVEAGQHYLQAQHLSSDLSEEEVVDTAVKAMALDDLKPFNPKKKVIEYLMMCLMTVISLLNIGCQGKETTEVSEAVVEQKMINWEDSARVRYMVVEGYLQRHATDSLMLEADKVADFCKEHEQWRWYYYCRGAVALDLINQDEFVKALHEAEKINLEAVKQDMNPYGLAMSFQIFGRAYAQHKEYLEASHYMEKAADELRKADMKCPGTGNY